MGVVIRIALLALVACTNPKNAFECGENSACRNGGETGVCVGGYCGFMDSQCTTGFRYGDEAGELAGQCVGSGTDGGIDGSPESVVLGAWSSKTRIPISRYANAGVAVGNRIYILGGIAGSTPHAEVTFGDVIGGTISWTETTPLPVARRSLGAATNGQAVFSIGGRTETDPDADEVLGAMIGTDGMLGAWQPTLPLPTGLRCMSVVSKGNYAYVVGGKTGATPTTDVLVGTMTGATISQWRSAGVLPKPSSCGAAVISGNYLYVVGGCMKNQNGCPLAEMLAEVFVAPIRVDGTLGPFVATTALPAPRWHNSVTVTNGRLLMATGDEPGMGNTLVVYAASVQAGGGIGAWQTVTPLPAVTSNRSVMQVVDGHVFVIGQATVSAPFQ